MGTWKKYWFACPLRSLAAGVLLCGLAVGSQAEEPFRTGQTVEVNFNEQWVAARVVRIAPNGRAVQIRIGSGPAARDGVVPIDRVRAVESAVLEVGDAEMRTWTDASGAFQIEARLAAIDGEQVKLRKADGNEVVVPLERLSAADRQYVRTAQNASTQPTFSVGSTVDVLWGTRWYPAKVLKIDQSRFFIHYDDHDDKWDEWVGPERIRPRASNSSPDALAATPSAAGTPAAAGSGATAPTALQLTAEVCVVRSGSATPVDRELGLPKVPLEPAVAPNMPQGRVVFPKLEFFESITGFVVADPAKHTLLTSVAYSSPGKKATRWVWGGLDNGQITQQAAVGGAHRLLAGDPQHGWLLTLDIQNSKQMTVWEWPEATAEPQPQYALQLDNDFVSAFANEFSNAYLVGNGQVVLDNGGGNIAVWDLANRKLLQTWEGFQAAVNRQGWMAVSTNEGIGLCELSSGKQLGFWKTDGFVTNQLSFSPNGVRLACRASGMMKVLDLSTGQIVYDGSLPPSDGRGASPPLWCGEQHLLLDRQYLFDLQAGHVVWHYTDRSLIAPLEIMRSLGNTLGYVSTDAPAVCSMQLPHPMAQQAVAKLEPRAIYALLPGDPVSVQTSGLTADMQSALEASITRAGWRIVPNAPVTIVASVAAGQAQTATLSQGLSGTGASSTVSFTPQISSVDIQVDGNSALGFSSQTGIPLMIVAPSGKSAQEALSAYEKADASFFGSLPFPQRVLAPRYLRGLATSELSSQGIGISREAQL